MSENKKVQKVAELLAGMSEDERKAALKAVAGPSKKDVQAAEVEAVKGKIPDIMALIGGLVSSNFTLRITRKGKRVSAHLAHGRRPYKARADKDAPAAEAPAAPAAQTEATPAAPAAPSA